VAFSDNDNLKLSNKKKKVSDLHLNVVPVMFWVISNLYAVDA